MSGTAGSPRHEALSLAIQPSGGTPAPSGFVLGPAAAIGSQVLPLLSADVTGAPAVPAGTKRISFWVTYTRGAAGGYPGIRVAYRNTGSGVRDYQAPIVDLASFAAAAPLADVNFYQEELKGPIPASDAPIYYELTFDLPANTVAVILKVRELGVPATPGTIAVDWTADG